MLGKSCCLRHLLSVFEGNNLSKTRHATSMNWGEAWSGFMQLLSLLWIILSKHARKKWQQTPGLVCSPFDYGENVLFGRVTILNGLKRFISFIFSIYLILFMIAEDYRLFCILQTKSWDTPWYIFNSMPPLVVGYICVW